MIDLKSKQKYINFTFIKRIVLFIMTLPTIIFGIIILVLSVVNKQTTISFPSIIMVILMALIILSNIIFTIIGAIFKMKLRKETVQQFFDIINYTKINNNPKVVYVYTCHNDFIPQRVIQNSRQTYKNLETWISDGSSGQEAERIKSFAESNKINYYRSNKGESKNKADNLNSFLANSGVTFDYLLITDSDEALHECFVEQALKCFYSNKFRNLGFVSPLNYFYGDRTLFMKWGVNLQNINEWTVNYTKSFALSNIPNLFSASCLITKKLLDKNSGLFPEGCLEDYFLEHIAITSGFSGLILPTSPCGQEFDQSLKAAIKRTMRIYDWEIYLLKKKVFIDYNEKYKGWYRLLITISFTPLIALIGYILLPWILLFFILYWNALFTNPLFITLFVGLVLQLIIYIATLSLGINRKTMLNEYGRWYGLFAFLFGLAIFGPMCVHFINSFFKDKYSDFTPTGSIKNHKSKELVPVVSIILSILFIAATITTFIITNNLSVAKPWMLLLFLYILLLLVIIFGCSLSFIILSKASNKIKNPYFNLNQKVIPPKFYDFDPYKNKVKSPRQGGEYD